jgi:hypothetical protein
MVSAVNTTAGITQVWMRPLSDGTIAVTFVNAATVAQYISVSFA